MEIALGVLLFVSGLFAGLYFGKCGELHRIRKGGQNKNNQKGNGQVVNFPNKNKKAANET